MTIIIINDDECEMEEDINMLETDEILDALGALNCEYQYLLHSEYSVVAEDHLISCCPVMVDTYTNAKEHEFAGETPDDYLDLKDCETFNFDDMDCINIREEDIDDKMNCLETQLNIFDKLKFEEVDYIQNNKKEDITTEGTHVNSIIEKELNNLNKLQFDDNMDSKAIKEDDIIEDKKINCLENQFERFVRELRRLMESELMEGTNGNGDNKCITMESELMEGTNGNGDNKCITMESELMEGTNRDGGNKCSTKKSYQEDAVISKENPCKDIKEKVGGKPLKNGILKQKENKVVNKVVNKQETIIKNENGKEEPLTVTDKPHICELCGKAFMHKFTLNRHKIVHSDKKTIDCKICGKTFKTLLCVRKHREVHLGDKPFRCELCGKAFARQTYLTRHKELHSESKPVSCEICMKVFKTEVEMKRHFKLVHGGDTRFSCELCSKIFKSNGDLIRHRKRAHSFKDVYYYY